MEPLTFFKIWSLRGSKGVIYLTQAESTLLNLIVKASEKFGINGAQLVLQKDGTDIDDDIILQHFKDEVLLLLEPGQRWNGTSDDSMSMTTSNASTVTVTSVSDGADFAIEAPVETPPDVKENESHGESTITLTIDCNSNVIWKLFELPWETLPKNIFDACDKGKVKDHQAKTYVIQTVVNKMREIKEHIPASAIHIVAQKIIDRFPAMFKDIDEDGIVIGDGTHSLFRKIQDRNNYLNRQKVPKEQECAVKNKKRRVAERAGCTSWSPKIDDDCEPQVLNCADPHLEDKIDKCFAHQRKFILDNPDIAAIRKTWPILLTKEGTFCHFKKLTSSDANLFIKAVAEKYQKFEKLAASLSKYELDKSKPKALQMFLIITNQLKESASTFYKELEGNSIDDILDTIDEMHPFIVKFVDSQQYHLILEKTKIYEDSSFVDIFCMAFCLYFNFNLKYPPKASLSFDFIQRYIFKIHPDSGSKIGKLKNYKQGSKSRVFTLMKKLRDF